MIPEVRPHADAWQRVTDDLVHLARTFAGDWDAPCGEGDWTNRMLLAHLATGYVVRIARLRAAIEGTPVPEFDVDAENARHLEALRNASVDEIVAKLVATRGEVLSLLDRLQPRHLAFEIKRTTGTATIGSTLASLSDHDLEHAATLRAAASAQ